MTFNNEDIFNQREGLIGSQCADCGEYYFPQASTCRNCASLSMQRVALGKSGTLWSWTLQRIKPKPPFVSDESRETFTPYGVGLVQMECGLIVKSRLRAEPMEFSIGMPLSMHVASYGSDEHGERLTFEFQPGDLS